MHRALTTTVVLLGAATMPAAAQTSGEFVIRKGKDTVAVERFTREAGTLQSEIWQTNGLHLQFVIGLKPDESIDHVEMARQGRQGPAVRVSADFADTLATLRMSNGTQADTMPLVAAHKAQPFLAVSFALTEQLARGAHLAFGKSVTWTAVRLGAADTTALTITRFHPDSVAFVMADVAIKVALSKTGDVMGGAHSLQPWQVERHVTVAKR